MPDASGPSEVAMQAKYVVREWGGVAIQTAIAVSQRNFGPIDGRSPSDIRVNANCVVLSRSDEYYDALAGRGGHCGPTRQHFQPHRESDRPRDHVRLARRTRRRFAARRARFERLALLADDPRPAS
jgi:hypothetical protein